jgi:hypothetical protein
MADSKQGLPENDIEIKNVTFLTPAKISLISNSQEKIVMVNVDIINRKVYTGDGDDSLSDYVFSHLDQINTLPEDFFMASEEIREEAAKAEADRDQLYKEAVGVKNE